MPKKKGRLFRIFTAAGFLAPLFYVPVAYAQVPSSQQSAQDIYRIILLIINFLSAAVAVVVIMSIVAAGIQYTTSNADPQRLSAAKERVRNAVIAFVAFIFMWAFLQWLVPGGVLSDPNLPPAGGSNTEVPCRPGQPC